MKYGEFTTLTLLFIINNIHSHVMNFMNINMPGDDGPYEIEHHQHTYPFHSNLTLRMFVIHRCFDVVNDRIYHVWKSLRIYFFKSFFFLSQSLTFLLKSSFQTSENSDSDSLYFHSFFVVVEDSLNWNCTHNFFSISKFFLISTAKIIRINSRLEYIKYFIRVMLNQLH